MTYLILSPHTQPRRFTLSNKEQSEGWAGDVLILSPHTQALFMTSLTQTAGHKMAADFEKSMFNKREEKSSENCCVH